jgi:hypothetical protein
VEGFSVQIAERICGSSGGFNADDDWLELGLANIFKRLFEVEVRYFMN